MGARLGDPEILIEDLSVAYDAAPVFAGVSGRFAAGSLTALIGPNGSGKSTLLKAIAGLLEPRQGRIVLPGSASEVIAYLPQRSEIDRRFPLTCAELVLLGLWRRIGAFRPADTEDRALVKAALATVGLEQAAGRPVGALSIGQFQRALFARVIVQDAPIILLDEPFAGVDAETTETLLHLLPKWRAEGRTVIAALHDVRQVRTHFPETLSLDRRVLGWGPTEIILGSRGS